MPKGEYDYTFDAADPDVRAVNEGTYDAPVSRNAATGEVELNVFNPDAGGRPVFSNPPSRKWLWYAAAAFVAWKVLL